MGRHRPSPANATNRPASRAAERQGRPPKNECKDNIKNKQKESHRQPFNRYYPRFRQNKKKDLSDATPRPVSSRRFTPIGAAASPLPGGCIDIGDTGFHALGQENTFRTHLPDTSRALFLSRVFMIWNDALVLLEKTWEAENFIFESVFSTSHLNSGKSHAGQRRAGHAPFCILPHAT